ncbi:hypothetical protein Srufu_006960 [Streptomyces libani subsp. rufus]|nr:hypothetical protein Srufu_006960 [Streptomyces libani subsp. rufus]
MSPRSASVNEELRRRSRERLLQATVELVGEHGYEATRLADIAREAGVARGWSPTTSPASGSCSSPPCTG